jgi:hypothetical protein
MRKWRKAIAGILLVLLSTLKWIVDQIGRAQTVSDLPVMNWLLHPWFPPIGFTCAAILICWGYYDIKIKKEKAGFVAIPENKKRYRKQAIALAGLSIFVVVMLPLTYGVYRRHFAKMPPVAHPDTTTSAAVEAAKPKMQSEEPQRSAGHKLVLMPHRKTGQGSVKLAAIKKSAGDQAAGRALTEQVPAKIAPSQPLSQVTATNNIGYDAKGKLPPMFQFGTLDRGCFDNNTTEGGQIATADKAGTVNATNNVQVPAGSEILVPGNNRAYNYNDWLEFLDDFGSGKVAEQLIKLHEHLEVEWKALPDVERAKYEAAFDVLKGKLQKVNADNYWSILEPLHRAENVPEFVRMPCH